MNTFNNSREETAARGGEVFGALFDKKAALAELLQRKPSGPYTEAELLTFNDALESCQSLLSWAGDYADKVKELIGEDHPFALSGRNFEDAPEEISGSVSRALTATERAETVPEVTTEEY